MSILKFGKISPMRDEVREMLIASADYTSIAQGAEILQQTNPRKRRGSLSGLTLEEKIRRKKLKNREAAQNSRDKKKAYVANLEDTISALQEENKLMAKKMKHLLQENEKLKEKNEKIERQLLELSVNSGKERSAVPRPQQKETTPLSALTQITVSILFSTWMVSIGLMKPARMLTWTSCQNWLILLQTKLWSWRQKTSSIKWWGPGQKAWNPPEEMRFML